LTGSLARQSCPAVLPGSLAVLPGNLARQSCPAVLPGSLAQQISNKINTFKNKKKNCLEI
jgi:hypothetical protein